MKECLKPYMSCKQVDTCTPKPHLAAVSQHLKPYPASRYTPAHPLILARTLHTFVHLAGCPYALRTYPASRQTPAHALTFPPAHPLTLHLHTLYTPSLHSAGGQSGQLHRSVTNLTVYYTKVCKITNILLIRFVRLESHRFAQLDARTATMGGFPNCKTVNAQNSRCTTGKYSINAIHTTDTLQVEHLQFKKPESCIFFGRQYNKIS